MKIGVLTLPLHTNYGGILQAYALQTILKRMGHEVEVIDKVRNIVFEQLPLHVKIKRFIKKYVLFQPIQPLSWELRKKQNKHTWKFIDQHIIRKVIENLSEIKSSEYETIIVGSDQIWRPQYFQGNYKASITNAFLDFAKTWNIKRIAYAPSFGTDVWEYSDYETIKCKELIQLFTAVSVREASGIDLLKENLAYTKACLGIDPTLLLKQEDYIDLFQKAKIKTTKGNLLVYILDDNSEKQELINTIASNHKLIPFYVNSKVESPNLEEKNCTQPPVEQWLRGFYDAEFVITDSFHACIFSIIFGKPFIVYGNKERGMARFTSLLNLFNLEDRLILHTKDYSPSKIRSNIIEAQQLLSKYREQGYLFLQTALQ